MLDSALATGQGAACPPEATHAWGITHRGDFATPLRGMLAEWPNMQDGERGVQS